MEINLTTFSECFPCSGLFQAPASVGTSISCLLLKYGETEVWIR